MLIIDRDITSFVEEIITRSAQKTNCESVGFLSPLPSEYPVTIGKRGNDNV